MLLVLRNALEEHLMIQGCARIVPTLVNFVILLRNVLRVTRISSYLVVPVTRCRLVVPVHKTVEKVDTATSMKDSARYASTTVMNVLTEPRVLNVFQENLYPLLVRTVLLSAEKGSTLTRQLVSALVVILLVQHVLEVKLLIVANALMAFSNPLNLLLLV